MNAPNRFELFVLGDGEKPAEYIEDTKIPHAATIKIKKQDHTLANMVRAQLLTDPAVLFAGYKVPHPLEPYFVIKVQTNGSVSPKVAVQAACSALIATINQLQTTFTTQFDMKELDADATVNLTTDAYGTTGGNYGASSGTQDYMDY